MTKNQTRNKETKQNFFQKNSRNSKIDLILPIIFAITPIDGSCYRVIDSSNIQEFFHLSQKVLSCNEEKTSELKNDKKKEMNINYVLKISKFCVIRLTKNKKNQ